jgi:hypothetical protein
MNVELNGLQSEGVKHTLLKSAFSVLSEKYKNIRAEQVESFRFAVGKIIDDDVKKELIKQGRPILEFPLPQQTLLYIAGKLQRDMTRFKAAPMQSGDEELAEIHSKLNEWAMEQTRGYKKIAKVALHAAIAKQGVINCFWDFNDSAEGEPALEPVDPFLVMFDPDPGQERFVCYSPMMSCEEIISIYAKYLSQEQIDEIRRKAGEIEGKVPDATGKPKGWIDRISQGLQTRWSNAFGGDRKISAYDPFVDMQNGMYRVIEWHDEREEVHKFVYSATNNDFEEIPSDLGDGEQVYTQEKLGEMTVDEAGQTVQRFPGGQVQEIRVRKIWITAIVPGLMPDKLLIEVPHPIQKRGFQFKRVNCYDWHPDPLQAQSILDSLKAPTQFYNQHSMTSMALAQDALLPPVDVPKGSIAVEDLPAWESGKRGIMRFFTLVGNQKPEPRYPPAFVYQILNGMMEEKKNLVEYTSGISPNARGFQESSSESGRLFDARTAQTEVMIAYFFGNVQEATRDIFNYMDSLMQKYMTLPREVRLLNDPSNPEWISLNMPTLEGVQNDITQGMYDFIPDERQVGESARREKILLLGQLQPMAANDPVISLRLLSTIFLYLDMPEGKELAALARQQADMAQGMQIQQAQVAQQASQMQLAQQKLQIAGGAKQLMAPPEKKGKAA